MSRSYIGYTPSKWGLKKCKRKVKETTDNRTYKIARQFERNGAVDCIICMGKCGYGPKRANKWKRNCGKKPRYKDKGRRSIKDFVGV